MHKESWGSAKILNSHKNRQHSTSLSSKCSSFKCNVYRVSQINKGFKKLINSALPYQFSISVARFWHYGNIFYSVQINFKMGLILVQKLSRTEFCIFNYSLKRFFRNWKDSAANDCHLRVYCWKTITEYSILYILLEEKVGKGRVWRSLWPWHETTPASPTASQLLVQLLG